MKNNETIYEVTYPQKRICHIDQYTSLDLMKVEEDLKKELRKIKNNNWNIESEIDCYELSLKMMDNIGSIDSELRDNLILTMFYKMIEGKKLSHEQLKEILKICLSEKYIFYSVGKVNDDSVFKRTFSMLIIEAIISFNNKEENNFLSESEILSVYKKVMQYFKLEKDLRGYDKDKGWAHSTAHTADCLCSLAESKYIKEKELKEILEIIKYKVSVNYYTYINEEDERLTNTFMCIYNRNIISTEGIVNWINSFKYEDRKHLNLDEEHLRENCKLFLRSLYFRAKKFNLEEAIINTIIDALDSLPKFY